MSKEKEKAEIARLAEEAGGSARTEAEARVRDKTNDVERAAVEAAANTRAIVEAGRSKRQRP